MIYPSNKTEIEAETMIISKCDSNLEFKSSELSAKIAAIITTTTITKSNNFHFSNHAKQISRTASTTTQW